MERAVLQEHYVTESPWDEVMDSREVSVFLKRLNLHTRPHKRPAAPALVQHLKSTLDMPTQTISNPAVESVASA